MMLNLSCCLMPYLFLLNPQHMIADAVRMIRHCQSDQPGESLQLWISVVTEIIYSS